ncbi:MAG: DUF2776 family protein, partial [Aeriscardovia sp.]|nr:DUF2776 family protein [Aeriscardovia sp.]
GEYKLFKDYRHKPYSFLLRLITLSMTAFTLAFGFYLLFGRSSVLPGKFMIALSSVTFALYTVVASTMRPSEGIHPIWPFPTMGYMAGWAITIWGLTILARFHSSLGIVSGHLVFGVGMIAICISTISMTTIDWIHLLVKQIPEGKGMKYAHLEIWSLTAIPSFFSIVGFVYAIVSLCLPSTAQQIGGDAMMAQSFVCLALVFLIHILSKQANNIFLKRFRWRYSIYIVCTGTINIVWGICVAAIKGGSFIPPGFGMIGLGLVCFAVCGKAHRVIGSWRNIPDIDFLASYFPILTLVAGLLISIVLFSTSLTNPDYTYAAYIMSGLSCVCLSIFGIVALPSVDASGV